VDVVIDDLDAVLAQAVQRFRVLLDELSKIKNEKEEYPFSYLSGFFVNFSHVDQLRLLNLFSWSEYFHLPTREILVFLLLMWKGKFGKNTRGLGVRLATLLGPASYAALRGWVAQRYPNGENVTAWKAEARLRITATFTGDRADEDVSQYVEAYQATIQRTRDSAARLSKKLSRRRFRDNPFIE
jgi:hypothetical protein